MNEWILQVIAWVLLATGENGVANVSMVSSTSNIFKAIATIAIATAAAAAVIFFLLLLLYLFGIKCGTTNSSWAAMVFISVFLTFYLSPLPWFLMPSLSCFFATSLLQKDRGKDEKERKKNLYKRTATPAGAGNPIRNKHFSLEMKCTIPNGNGLTKWTANGTKLACTISFASENCSNEN